MTPLSEVELGAKVSAEVYMPDGQWKWITARKIGKGKLEEVHRDGTLGITILVEPSHSVEVIERPHEDGDFSYLCGFRDCRCRQ